MPGYISKVLFCNSKDRQLSSLCHYQQFVKFVLTLCTIALNQLGGKYKKRGVEYGLYRLTLYHNFVHVVSQYKSDDSGGQSQKLYLSFANKKPTWELEIKSADGSINPQTVIHKALCCLSPIVGISNIMHISNKMFLCPPSLLFDMYLGTS